MFSPVHTFGSLFIWFSCQVSAVIFQQSPPQIVKDSTEVQINCSHDDTSLSIMLWYEHRTVQDSLSMTLIGSGYDTSAPNYEGQFEQQFKLTREDAVRGSLIIRKANPSQSAVYFCAATANNNQPAYFGQGTKLTVLGKEDGLNITPPTVQVLRPSSKECGNDDAPKKTIVCVASGFYPDHVSVSWQVDGEAVTTGVATDNAALREDDFYKITSRLRVSTKNWFNPETVFTCTVSFYNGTHTETYSDSLHGEEGGGMTREKYLRSTQTAKLSYGVFIIKSSIYGACVAFLVWKLQRSAGKQNH
ncbi:immunoglobulin delta heavy chain-like [Cottoperca gobio]|uniref:immunoglobulin delta heavy chain-like n=1 Tax=Cottoperca gobio TaxID=56716 RepID=UPI00110D2D45|nr:immunoglobulin delta heavy chain-like [Cottoperca gobio]